METHPPSGTSGLWARGEEPSGPSVGRGEEWVEHGERSGVGPGSSEKWLRSMGSQAQAAGASGPSAGDRLDSGPG